MAQDLQPPIDTARLTDTFGNDVEFLTEMYGLYVDDTHKRLEDLNRALLDRDADRLERVSHALKGSSASIGAQRMFELADALNRLCPDPDFDRAAGLAEKLAAEFSAVENFVRDHYEPLP